MTKSLKLIIRSLYHLVVPSIFQLESPSLRAAAVLKHLLCCSSLTRLRGGEIHDVRSNSPESKSLWSEQRPLWIKMIHTRNVVQHINQFQVDYSQFIIWYHVIIVLEGCNFYDFATLGPLGLCSGTFIIGAATNLWPVLLQLGEFQASASRRKAMVAMTISEILPTTF